MKNAHLIEPGESTVYGPGVMFQDIQIAGEHGTTCPVEFIEFWLEPFATSTPHSHPSTEIWRITSGRGRVKTDDGELDVKAGDLVFLLPNTTHNLENLGSDRLAALSISWRAT